MEFIWTILIGILESYILYHIFEKRGFFSALVFEIFGNILIYYVGADIKIMDWPIKNIIMSAVFVFFLSLVLTIIDYWLYGRSKDFFYFFIKRILCGIVIGILLAVIVIPFILKFS